MAGNRSSKDDKRDSLFNELLKQMQACATSADLWKLAQSEEFQTSIALVDDDEREQLRQDFKSFDTALKGKVKAEDLQDLPITVKRWKWETSPQYPDREFLVISLVRDDKPDEPLEWVSGAYKVMQFFRKQGKDGIHTKTTPDLHITIVQEDEESMRARKAKPGTGPMWLVMQSSKQQKRTAGAPF